MGNNEKDKRQNTSVELVTRNGVIEKLQMFTQLSGSKIDYQGYVLDKNGNYIYDQKDLDVSLKGTPKEKAGFPQKDIDSNNVLKTVTDFIVANNGKNKFDIKIDGKDVNYKELCDALNKSDMLLEARNIATAGYSSSLDISPSARNKRTADVEKFGTPGAKAVFEEIKKLSNNGTTSITRDKGKHLSEVGNKYSDIEIFILSDNVIQIIQDRGYENHKPKGPNFDCFNVCLDDLKNMGPMGIVGASVNFPSGKPGAKGKIF